MRTVISSMLAGLLLLSLATTQGAAQSPTALVVTSCGVIPSNRTYAADTYAVPTVDTRGRPCVARPADGWVYAPATAGISNTTTAVTVKAAAGAGVRNCISDVQVSAGALGAATVLAIRDGAGGTVLWRLAISTAGLPAGFAASLRSPICGTANTLMEVVTLTASTTGAVYFNAQGFVAP